MGSEPAVTNLEIEIRKPVTLPRNVLIEQTAVKQLPVWRGMAL